MKMGNPHPCETEGTQPRAMRFLTWTRVLTLNMIALMFIYLAFHEGDGLRQGIAVAGCLVLNANHFLYRVRPQFSWLPYWVDVGTAAVLGLAFLGENTLYMILLGVFGVTFTLATENRRQILLFVGLCAGVCLFLFGMEWVRLARLEWLDYGFNFCFFAFSMLVGKLIRYYSQARLEIGRLYGELENSHAGLQAAHEQLRDYARQVEVLTATRERNHIAREIHDGVGHRMTALLVQLQAARKLQDRDLEQSRETLQRCEELARSALQEVRLSVRTLHEESAVPLSILGSLRQLLSEFSAMTDLATTLNVEGATDHVTLSLHPVIIRIVQESLTNAKRHGEATQADVFLRCSPERIMLEVRDNGIGAAKMEAGFGLINMRDRVMEQGGTVLFTTEAGSGFRMAVTFPLQQQTWAFGGRRA